MNVGSRKYLSSMVVILLLAFALGAFGLNSDLVWIDELSSLQNFGAYDPPYGPADVIASISNFAPLDAPLFFLTGAIWGQFSGWSAFALRLLPLLAGVLAIAWFYQFVADALSQRAALVATALLSTNAFAIVYLHELRPYSFMMLFTVMHLVYFWRAAHNPVFGRFQGAMFIATATALLYTHVFALVLFAGLVCHHFVFFYRIRRWVWILLGWAIGLALYLPYLATMLDKTPRAVEGIRPASTLALLSVGSKVLTNGAEWLWIPLLLALLIALSRKRSGAVNSILVCACGMVVAILYTNWQFNVFAETRLRYTFAAWPVFIALFAWALTTVPRWKTFALVFIFIWTLNGFDFSRSQRILSYTGIMSRVLEYPPLNDYVYFLRRKVTPLDYLVGFSGSELIDRTNIHSTRSVSDYYLSGLLGIDGSFLHTHLKRYRLKSDVRDILKTHPHILLAHDPSDVPLNYAQTVDIIQDKYVVCDALVDEPNLLIRKYTHPLMDCDHEPSSIYYDNGINVVDYAAHYDASAERIQALIWWEVPVEDMLKEYNLSLQIVTPDWQNVRQIDRHLNDRVLPWRVIELSAAELPAGEYRLMLVLYHRDTGETIAGFDSLGSESSDIIPLLTIEIQS